jgi:hypothetical protein
MIFSLIALAFQSQGDRISHAPPSGPSGSDAEEILWQPVMMPSGDLYPSIDALITGCRINN